jgi:hypothetical protein
MQKAKSVVPPTKSIPITKGLESTAGELQLKEDEARADYRDLCMYARIINGIMIGRKGQSNVETLNNIVRTRHLPVQDLSSSSYEDDCFDKYTISSLKTNVCCGIMISPDELIPYTFDAKDEIPIIIIQSAEETESREEEIIFVLDL